MRWVGSPAAARFSCKRAMVSTGGTNSHPSCMNGLRKPNSHLVGGSFLAERAVWFLNMCLPTENAD